MENEGVEMSEDLARFKLGALFHDPPLKVLNIQRHESRSSIIYRRLGIEIDGKEREIIHQADVLASAIDRLLFKDRKVEPKVFTSPFEDKPQELENLDMIFEREDRIVDEISWKDTFVDKFYYAWWKLGTDKLFNYIPADTRAPNHSIVSHMVRTASIATSIKVSGSFSLLLFTIGPVQSFIKNARKTRDLWAGSYILSYLIWKAMLPIIKGLGPDHVIFPSLAGQFWMKLFLTSKRSLENEKYPDVYEISTASFPNRFFAIVPSERKWAEMASSMVRDAWKRIMESTMLKTGITDTDIPKIFERFIDTRWVMLNIPCSDFKNIECIKAIHEEIKKLIDEENQNGDFLTSDDIVNALKEEDRAYSKTYAPTVFYSQFHTISEKALASVKSFRKSEIKVMDLEKYGDHERCSICGEFPAVAVVREGEILPYSEGDREETLCPICLTKRNFHYFLANDLVRNYGYPLSEGELVRIFGGFPSTSEIAGTMAKESVLEFLNEHRDLDVSQPSEYHRSVPKIEFEEKFRGLKLLKVDSSVLFGEDPKEYGLSEFPKELIEIARDSGKLTRYYALIAMDGDRIGEWLSGKRNKKFHELMAKKDGESLALEALKSKIHPMTPSMHDDFSKRLLNFSKRVFEIVKGNYGELIYSGGDDVLALFPVERGLVAAYEIRKEFSKHLSSRATMSAGIVLSHSKSPFRETIETVFQAEKNAKKSGRDTFCLIVLKRSGETVSFCQKWRVGDVDIVPMIAEILKGVKEGDTSRKFFYDTRKLLENSENFDIEVAEAILRLNFKKKREGFKDEKLREKMERLLKLLNENFVPLLDIVSFLTRGGEREGD